MTNKIDGGAAFPQSGYAHWAPEGGMTLRDYFSAKAMQGMMSNDNLLNRYKISGEENHISPDVMACTAAYSMADAMLEARNK